MSLLGWLLNRSVLEVDEQEPQESETEMAMEDDFSPFTCRKCGEVVTNPYEVCPAEQER